MKTAQEQIQQEYIFLDKLGQGAFGYIISVQSKVTGNIYACKIQKNHGRRNILVQKQFKMLAQMMDSKKFPLVYSMKKFPQNSFIIMQKLNQNLNDLLIKRGQPFSIKTIALIAQQLLGSFEIMHRLGYLHRDLKPENIMTTQTNHQMKLIDFGLADSISVKRSVSLIGNVRFASRGAHLGYSSKMDDLQQFIYVLYYLLLGKLPWQNVKSEDIQKQIDRDIANQDQYQLTPILTMKIQFLDIVQYPVTKSCVKQEFYRELHQLSKYIFGLKRGHEPDYNLLMHKADRLRTIAGAEKGQCYDWCDKDCPHQDGYSKYWSVYDS